MKSFDFFDTLFVRLVAKPEGIFQLMEYMLALPGFCERRKAAERAVTVRRGVTEITLSEIYAELDLGEDLAQKAFDLETSLEKSLISPISKNIVKINRGDIVVSDMYLPKDFFESVLVAALPTERRPTPLISSTIGKRKSDGRLWEHILELDMRPQLHIGDNKISDVKRPSHLGIPSEYYGGAELNRYEKSFVKKGLSGNIIAGVARGARLSNELLHENDCITDALTDVFASVFAPVIVGFVDNLLNDALKKNITDIFFLARDGQIPFRVASQLIKGRSLPLRAHYIYASRQSLHMAGYMSPETAASWLLEDTPDLSIATIASRCNLPLSTFFESARQIGVDDLHRSIPRDLRGQLIDMLHHDDVALALLKEAKRQWEVAIAYFRRAGLRPGKSVAIVDVGWNGRIQQSLQSILDRDSAPKTNLTGYYLCLSQKVRSSPSEKLIGFLHDPDDTPGICPFDPYRPVIEASLFANHGSTEGFKWDGPNPVAKLGPAPKPELLQTIVHQQETIMKFTEFLLQVEAVTGYKVNWSADDLRSLLLKFLTTPSSRDALAFARHEIDIEQSDQVRRPLVLSNLGWSDLRRRSIGYWPEGSLALSGYQHFLAAARFVRFLLTFIKRRANANGFMRFPAVFKG